MKKIKLSAAFLLAVAAILAGGSFHANAQKEQVAIPLKSVPTFSTARIARQGHFLSLIHI